MNITKYDVSNASSGSGSVTTTALARLEPHSIYGNIFNGTNDVEGVVSCEGVTTEGDISAHNIALSGDMDVRNIEAHNILCETVVADEINANLEITSPSGKIDEIESNYIETTDFSTESISAESGRITSIGGEQLNYDRAELEEAVIQALQSTDIVTDNLTVNRLAKFFQLEVEKIKATGGAVIVSPAQGFKVAKVVRQQMWVYKRVYFLGEDTINTWQVGDLAVCQSFNARSGSNVSNKFFWAEVTGVGQNVTLANDERTYHYIDISIVNKVGEVNPEEGDEIAMLGNKRNPDRQSAIYISAYDSIDTTLQAPFICHYKGINDFSLSNHKYTWFAANGSEIRGNLKVDAGKTVEEYINEKYVSGSNMNLFDNSDFKQKTPWMVPQSVSWIDGLDGTEALYCEATSDNVNSSNYVDAVQYRVWEKGGYMLIKPNTTYTLSFWAKGQQPSVNHGAVAVFIYPECIDTSKQGIVDGVPKNLLTNGMTDFYLDDDWSYHTITFTTKSTIGGTIANILWRVYLDGSVAICKPKLEEGRNATPWMKSNNDLLGNREPMNLLNQTSFEQMDNWYNQGGEVVENAYNGYNGYYGECTDGTSTYKAILRQYLYGHSSLKHNILEPNTWYTFSFWAKGNHIIVSWYPSAAEVSDIIIDGVHKTAGTTGYTGFSLEEDNWTFHTYTFKTKATLANGQNLFIQANQGFHFTIAQMKLEKGMNPTKWQPSLRDIERAAEPQIAELAVNMDSISARVDDVELRIDNQKITLNGDTEINGSLTLNDEDQGFILSGDGGTTQITPQSIGTSSDFFGRTTISQHISGENTKKVSAYIGTQSNAYKYSGSYKHTFELGSFPSGTLIRLRNITTGITFPDNNWVSGSLIVTVRLLSGETVLTTNGFSSNSKVAILSTRDYTTNADMNIQLEVSVTYNYTVPSKSGVCFCQSAFDIEYPSGTYMMMGYDGLAANFGGGNFYVGNSGVIFNFGDYKLTMDGSGLKFYKNNTLTQSWQ